jgi:hypothetical protein
MRRDESKPGIDPAEQQTAGAPRIHGEVVPWESGEVAGRADETEVR